MTNEACSGRRSTAGTQNGRPTAMDSQSRARECPNRARAEKADDRAECLRAALTSVRDSLRGLCLPITEPLHNEIRWINAALARDAAKDAGREESDDTPAARLSDEAIALMVTTENRAALREAAWEALEAGDLRRAAALLLGDNVTGAAVLHDVAQELEALAEAVRVIEPDPRD